uniref:Large ribosomal subunit protein uL23c n=1 Tax=Caulerpa ashmeadii TaxID=177078 RepID=A0A6B9VX44_9CHLO|nr:50S ribosomal protein L23 [Caulerpa ashmeadii]QHQ73318.1 50S ribosomal protein L23 [Caulerpa ashmeadii]
MFDFLSKPLLTEKATKLIEKKQYTFEVNSSLTKKQIQKIFEQFYSIKIQWVKIQRSPKEKKSKPKKKAIIKFSKQIPIF